MVFIHGESFEWNSGNPYDGSVLAAYGQVIVVTLNFRLGILGFLKAGIESGSQANFGLIDQLAALLWVRDNIAQFGGNPNAVTLFGHGTGAACIGHLMSSPMIEKENQLMFHRAILMSGSPLSDWALATKPLDVTLQVAKSLNCPLNEAELTACLRTRRLQDIMTASVDLSPYTTVFGPVVDNLLIRNDPIRMLSEYNDVFSRLQLMYGVTEIESAHLLGAVALIHGMLERERDYELRNYLRMRCEFEPDSCLARTLETYDKSYHIQDEGIMAFTSHEPDRASLARDMLLDVLSDAGYAAPIALTGKLHARLNPQSYFYVFGHTTSSKDYVLNKSIHGEELPYVFGVPLDGPKFHFEDHYSKEEKLFSELVMSLWCNFAYSGDPNYPGYSKFTHSFHYDTEWPEYDEANERYLYLATSPMVKQHYRKREMVYWNDFFPKLSTNRTLSGDGYSEFPIPPRTKADNFGKEIYQPKQPRPADDIPYDQRTYGTVVTGEPTVKTGSTMNALIVFGAIFLVANVVLFSGLYIKCCRAKKRNIAAKSSYEDPIDNAEVTSEKEPKVGEAPTANGCSLMQMISNKSSRSEDTYEAVKTNETTSSKRKLTRQMSSSTIDAHAKVRDWIANEIVHRCSPRFLRRSRNQASIDSKKQKEEKQDSQESKPLQICVSSKMTGSNSTLGQSPTRPVSPVEGSAEPAKPSLIPVQKSGKKTQKVSVAVDATPAGRGSSVLRQQPIELTKSLDYSSLDSGIGDIPLKRSVTLDDCSGPSSSQQFLKSSTNINLKFHPISEPTIIKIEHGHSKSDPIEMAHSSGKKLKTFEPQDVNVTSRDEVNDVKALTPEESLQTIKRRNFPKVLPDFPGESKQSLATKRRSMPAPGHLFLPIPENSSLSQPNSPTGKCLSKHPPVPPPRISSSLGRSQATPILPSLVQLAAEPELPEEPEVAYNNLYIGPLIPSRENRKVILKPADSYRFNNQPIYDNLNPKPDKRTENTPKAIVSSDPSNPVRRMEPKVIIKPKITRTISDPAKNKGPRVMVNDNIMDQADTKQDQTAEKERRDSDKNKNVELDQLTVPKTSRHNSKQKSSQIPTIVKSSNTNLSKESSSESTPSEESDTGTVVKCV